MTVQVQQRVHIGDRHRFWSGCDLPDFVAGLYFAFLEHAKVEAGSPVLDEQRGHARLVHPDAQPVAGDPRLADLEQCRSDPVLVADADLIVGEPVDREVLAELTGYEVVAVHLLAPVLVRLQLIHVDGPVHPSVTVQIALAVTVYVQAPDRSRPGDRLLPDAGEDGPPLPRDLPRQPDVDRHEPPRGLRHRGSLSPLSDRVLCRAAFAPVECPAPTRVFPGRRSVE